MTEDLLTNVRQQLEERIEELRDAVEERDRLQANLRALEAEPWVLDAGLAGPTSADAEPEVPGTAPEALDTAPATPVAAEAGPEAMIPGQQTLDVELGMLAADPELLEADPSPPANVVRLPARPEPEPAPVPEPALASEPVPAPESAPAVSPKIARLMSAPRRPALERSGIARVGERADASARTRVDEDEPPDEIYEQAI